MAQFDLLSLRRELNDKNILLCFNGPISSGLIQELGMALKNYLRLDQATPSVSMDVFGVYIELTQNIRHYAQLREYGEQQSSATVVVGREADQGYSVLAGNVVERGDGEAIRQRIHALGRMDKAELKATYKQQLRQPRDTGSGSGAGLGLIDICRKTSRPLSCDLVETPDGKAFISILAHV